MASSSSSAPLAMAMLPSSVHSRPLGEGAASDNTWPQLTQIVPTMRSFPAWRRTLCRFMDARNAGPFADVDSVRLEAHRALDTEISAVNEAMVSDLSAVLVPLNGTDTVALPAALWACCSDPVADAGLRDKMASCVEAMIACRVRTGSIVAGGDAITAADPSDRHRILLCCMVYALFLTPPQSWCMDIDTPVTLDRILSNTDASRLAWTVGIVVVAMIQRGIVGSAVLRPGKYGPCGSSTLMPGVYHSPTFHYTFAGFSARRVDFGPTFWAVALAVQSLFLPGRPYETAASAECEGLRYMLQCCRFLGYASAFVSHRAPVQLFCHLRVYLGLTTCPPRAPIVECPLRMLPSTGRLPVCYFHPSRFVRVCNAAYASNMAIAEKQSSSMAAAIKALVNVPVIMDTDNVFTTRVAARTVVYSEDGAAAAVTGHVVASADGKKRIHDSCDRACKPRPRGAKKARQSSSEEEEQGDVEMEEEEEEKKTESAGDFAMRLAAAIGNSEAAPFGQIPCAFDMGPSDNYSRPMPCMSAFTEERYSPVMGVMVDQTPPTHLRLPSRAPSPALSLSALPALSPIRAFGARSMLRSREGTPNNSPMRATASPLRFSMHAGSPVLRMNTLFDMNSQNATDASLTFSQDVARDVHDSGSFDSFFALDLADFGAPNTGSGAPSSLY